MTKMTIIILIKIIIIITKHEKKKEENYFFNRNGSVTYLVFVHHANFQFDVMEFRCSERCFLLYSFTSFTH